MRKTLTAAALMLSCVSAAQANPANTMSNFSYDYTEVRIGMSPLTYGAGFSKSIHPNAHLTGHVDSEFENDWDIALGVGFHAPINNWADLTGELKARNIKNRDRFDETVGKTGMEVNLGVRQWLGPQLEVGAKIGHVNVHRIEETFGSVYGRFHATELFSVGAEGRINDVYGDQIMLTTRFKY
ncbi:hypothetical protein [Photobacterium galatheae]|uniref:Outer membrane protein beta-barrel domain-containing protein n=1 Tax=Photobacterium galatheae TaxID=1654360 RepID=A0A066S0U3_9GAMM|nr:hypothetical protein [Photobacterium galatheae]KDM93243.1 hypothetical protein EA58_03360 [Photobacterium galatheae]MCM0148229.1 hypothetical protein [Photobacterium galatheae]